MELCETTAKEVQAVSNQLTRHEERIKVLERGGRWLLGVAGTVVAAGIVALLTWLMQRP